MRHFQFTDEELDTIERERFLHPDPPVQRRMEILWLKAHGETHERIAELVGRTRRTVQRVLDLYWTGGVDAVRQMNYYHPRSALDGHQETIEDSFQKNPPHTIAEACDRIEQLTGVRRKETRVREFLRDLGFRWLKVSAVPVPPKKSVEEHAANQADFLKERVGAAT